MGGWLGAMMSRWASSRPRPPEQGLVSRGPLQCGLLLHCHCEPVTVNIQQSMLPWLECSRFKYISPEAGLEYHIHTSVCFKGYIVCHRIPEQLFVHGYGFKCMTIVSYI